MKNNVYFAQSILKRIQMKIIERHYRCKGESNLDVLNALYSTEEQWKVRADQLRTGILKGALLWPLPQKTPLHAHIGSVRTYSDYEVQNVYFESVPGFFVTGTLYSPIGKQDQKIPGILLPHGHFPLGRFSEDWQHLGASFARMGVVALTYDMVGWEKSDSTQIKHNSPHCLTFQLWNSIRCVDFLLSLPNIDPTRIAVTGASGGATQSFLLSAVDDRIVLSIPTVMVSSRFYGGCVCESGLPIHKQTTPGTNNAEIAALTAPRPQLLIAIGKDWSRFTPIREYPFIKRIYRFFGREANIEYEYFAKETHNYGPSKRQAAYRFLAKHFHLAPYDSDLESNPFDESPNIVESKEIMQIFTPENPRPATTLNSDEAILAEIQKWQKGS
jgi:dienelactone hydrolase